MLSQEIRIDGATLLMEDLIAGGTPLTSKEVRYLIARIIGVNRRDEDEVPKVLFRNTRRVRKLLKPKPEPVHFGVCICDFPGAICAVCQ